MSTQTKRCDHCANWIRFHGEVNGRCHALPPTPFANGESKRPITRESEWCGAHFTPLAAGEQASVKEKKQPETPAHAAKFAREQGKRR